MKKTVLLFLLLKSCIGFAQYTLIPHLNFEQILIDQGIDSGPIDGKVLTANISGLNTLNLKGKDCKDLTGIQDFTSLRFLNCESCSLINLDLSKNIFLEELDCSNNALSSLDLSNNILLKRVDAHINSLTNLDLSKNTALTHLGIERNYLTNLDVSKNTKLTELNCGANRLTSLDVSLNTALSFLSLYENQLTTIDISKNTALSIFSCSKNQISHLDVSKNTALTILNSSENPLNSIDVTKNTALTGLYCIANQLSNLDVSNNTALVDFSCATNNLINLDISKNTSLKSFYGNHNQFSDLDVSNNTSLTTLALNNNKLATLDIAVNTALVNLNCSNNQLTSLDVSKSPDLLNFHANDNQLANLNLKNGKNTKLIILDLKSNSNLSCIQVDNASYSNTTWSALKDASAVFSSNCSAAAIDPPKLLASGDQLYCPQTSIPIVTSFSITHDLNETGTQAAYIQISSGYANSFDKLELANPTAHPSVRSSWDVTAGKLTLSGSTSGVDILYSDLEAAIKDVVFSNSSVTASGTKTFSITIGQANYLPSTEHYYLYVQNTGVTWTTARDLAAASVYYGLKGYLATILSADEAKLIGEQASGTGWIGGSDAETEGVWKWVTGPEAGTVMSYTFWNSSEPNNQGNEDYAHITQPGVGIRGSWNDLSNTGSLTSGDAYQPKGYVVEYGGSAGESPLQIAASTKITIPTVTLTSAIPSPVCDSGSFTFTAATTAGATISWYDAATGSTPLATGNSYTTPPINTTTTYYFGIGCQSNRQSVVATVNKTPTTPVAVNPNVSRCGAGTVVLEASSDIGTINWFTASTGGISVYTGTSFTTPSIAANTTYYAEASNNGCTNTTRIPVTIVIYTPPVVTDETVALCQFKKVRLDAGIAGMNYVWSNGATTQTTEVAAGGTYTVVVTNPGPGNCSSTKKIIVNEHLIPEISRIDVNGTRAVIYVTKEQDYFEYSVDGTNYQDSNVFYDVPGGLRTAYVQEKSGCGRDTEPFVVLVFPPFFTPNNDTYNDLWEVTGMENYPQAQVTIFDRYGKLIAQLTSSKMNWDGTLDKIPLPASDYWYSLKIDDTKPILQGHFSLKR